VSESGRRGGGRGSGRGRGGKGGGKGAGKGGLNISEEMKGIVIRARIFKRLWSPGIDTKASIPPAYVAWRAGTITPIPTRCLGPIDFLKIPAQVQRGI
jgi:hypothetical protein